MSRIDEAMRRAAALLTPASNDAAPDPVAGTDVTTLAGEPFPIEIGERRRGRTDGAASTAPPVARERPTVPAEAAATRSVQRGSIFEHLDATLAEKVVADANMASVSREQYRRLAAVLHDAQGTNGLRVLIIASAVPGEGKTLTATNVALTLSESYQRRVLLIDADLRKPALHQVFQLNVASGLIEGLEAKGDTKLVVRQVSARLSVLPAGRPTSDPMAGLTSDRMRWLLEEAKETFDWVIIDTPPLMLLPDAHLLSSMVDGAVLIVKANSTPHELVKRAADIIGRKRITGVVLNQAKLFVQPQYNERYYLGYYLRGAEDVRRS